MKLKIIAALCMCISLSFVAYNKIQAQVTIGTGSAPEKAALLQIKNKDTATPGDITSEDGGILLPRVKLTDLGELAPFFSNEDMSKPTYENIEKPNHKGLLVYNVGGNNISEGVYFWNGDEWRNIQDMTGENPTVTNLLYLSATIDPQKFTAGTAYKGILRLPYEGGNGGKYPAGEWISSSGNTGIKIRLKSGQLEYGDGELIYEIKGTPAFSSPTGATFNISFNGPESTIISGTTTVGEVVEAESKYKVTLGPLEATSDNEVNGFAKVINSPNGKFSVRVFVPDGTAFQAADLQIRSNIGTPTIMWTSDYTWNGGAGGSAGNAFALQTEGMWFGNSGLTSNPISKDPNAAWGDPDVYYSAPEHRSYMWTTVNPDDKELYTLTFMLGAPSPTTSANSTSALKTKAYLKIEQIRTLD